MLYTLSFCAFTAVGFLHRPFPAAAALLALALGDGIGGAVGLRFGRHRFRLPGAKPKSLEGTLAVALMAGVGISLAARCFHAPLSPGLLVASALLAAAVEAISPRASDNLLLPAAVWAALALA